MDTDTSDHYANYLNDMEEFKQNKFNLETIIAPELALKIPIYNASCCGAKTHDDLQKLYNSSSTGAVLTKSSTKHLRFGNIEPRYYEGDNNLTLNSMGIPNHGYYYYKLMRDYFSTSKPYIQSIYPFDKEELKLMLSTTDYNHWEINLSCGNVNKKIIPYDFEEFESYLDIIHQSPKTGSIGLKLPPYYHTYEFDQVSNLLNKYDCIDYVVSMNSLANGLIIDKEKDKIVLFTPSGSIGGTETMKAIALGNVYQFTRRLTNTQVVGCGGVVTGKDVYDYMLVGACAVQIGSAFMREGVSVFDRVLGEFKDVMELKGYTRLLDIPLI